MHYSQVPTPASFAALLNGSFLKEGSRQDRFLRRPAISKNFRLSTKGFTP
jgi:hypothetical protein